MQYEIIKNSQKISQRNQSMKPGKKMRREVPRTQDVKSADFRRCHNCGERNHKAAECSFKNKGTKCFQCRKIGYIAANYGKHIDTKQVNECNVIKYDQKIYKTINIRGKPIIASRDMVSRAK